MYWQLCNACGHSFTNGYFTDEATRTLFSRANKYQVPSPELLERQRYIYARIIERISGVLKRQNGKWLDIGFGNGIMLTTCEEFGFTPVGIDMRKVAVDIMSSFGFEAYCMDFLEFRQFNSYTIISMADVLEHMPYPKHALAHAYKLLEAGGLLFVSCPNSDSFLWKILNINKRNPYWMEIEHYHNFGRKRLYELLKETGFEPLMYSISERYRVGMEVIAIKNT